MLIRGKRKGIWREREFLGIVQTKEEIGDLRRGLVYDFESLGVVPAEVHDLWFDGDRIGAHYC